MGLDIYAGTLTRYYAKNWKTVTQQAAEKNNWGFQVIRPDEDESQPQDVVPVEQIQEHMQQWSGMITTALFADGDHEPWEENNEKEYYTDKPDWCAFGALLLYGACLQYHLPIPQQIKKGWDYFEDSIVARALKDENFNWSLFTDAEWWLPFKEPVLFRCQAPNGVEITMGTTGDLLNELRKINELSWNADDSTIVQWLETEGYPIDGEIVDGTYKILEIHTEYDVESLAKYAFSILYQAALFSEKHGVPIIKDY